MKQGVIKCPGLRENVPGVSALLVEYGPHVRGVREEDGCDRPQGLSEHAAQLSVPLVDVLV